MAANIDMSLDDIINKSLSSRAPGGGGRRPSSSGPARSGGRAAPARTARTASRRAVAAPYSRGQRKEVSESDHLAMADVRDVAASRNPVLKVKSDSKPNTVAGAICNVVREAYNNNPPAVMATGPAAINQAMKAMAIARKYLLEDEKPIDFTVKPRFEQDIREGSNVIFELTKSPLIQRDPTEDDLAAKEKTDVFKLAGAIAGRVRDGEEVACTTKGAVPVLVVVKAIATAQDYLAEDKLAVKFAVSIVDLENPEIHNETSTYLHFALFSEAI